MTITAGDKAPDFRLPTDGDGSLSMAALKGKPAVLYFYPKDDTSGCTREALDFGALYRKFRAAGATIVGASKDAVASHDRFKKKHKLPFALVSDADGTLCAAYGVWVEKSLYGRKYFGIERSTFLIDGKGIVRRVWRKVKVPGHADEVLAAVKAL